MREIQDALCKQVPKKPISKEVEGGFVDICGNCEIAQVFDMYCERCGHRIGWREPTKEEQSNLPWEQCFPK